ncbi:hypothetical protein NP493_569g01006 [Ridgeia piscesae]|uniref:Myosin motor domain-containing protein n=1 Tax=Ridgeia piscesae TaxID=27915 RepID=A0AAD9KUJ6_RIDPI|nr:hypothetical protein NP493_569g01006 [Ridgeia piscesae]
MATEVREGTLVLPDELVDTEVLGEEGLEDMINLIHLFAIGNAAYSGLVKEAHNQVVVISGESGAGKTESTKLIMQYLAAVNKGSNSIITEQILEANPLLESFGNAKTIRNDNSSRFGKYVELYFRRGAIVGAKTSEYLLEKSRIVSQAADERNYHVFYELLKGLTEEEMKKYGLKSASQYFYLNQGGSCDIASKNDEEDFRKLRGAMEILSFTTKEQESIYRILACVLHVGNIYFSRTQNAHQHEGVEVSSVAEMKWVAYLLELSEDSLKEAFTMKVTVRLSRPLHSQSNM